MSNPVPLPASKRDRTRAALIEATLDLIAEKGFAAVSLDEVAARAGMTKGAIYSNFDGKSDLLLAAVSARGLRVNPSQSSPSDTAADHVRAMAAGLTDLVRRSQGEARFVAEFQLYALSDPELRERLAGLYARNFTASAEALERAQGADLTMPARHLAVALQSIALGFIVQSFISPQDIDEAVITETLNALARGLESGDGA